MTRSQIRRRSPVRTSSDRRWFRRKWLPAVCLAGLMTIFSAASGPAMSAAGAAASGSEPAIFNPHGRIGWKPCGKGFDCARVRVPLDWTRPAGRKIHLGVIRLRASKPRQRIGSLFINPGGPGGSGIDSVRSLRGAGGVFGDGRFDLVSWDVRRVGRGQHPGQLFREPEEPDQVLGNRHASHDRRRITRLPE